MANEVSIAVSLSYSKNGVSAVREESFKADVAGDSMTHAIQEVGTAFELLTEHGEVGTAGWYFLKNLDPTNFVEFGEGDNEFAIKLLPGESTVFRASDPIGGKADTGACLVEYMVIEL
jgi:hypothetical protein